MGTNDIIAITLLLVFLWWYTSEDWGTQRKSRPSSTQIQTQDYGRQSPIWISRTRILRETCTETQEQEEGCHHAWEEKTGKDVQKPYEILRGVIPFDSLEKAQKATLGLKEWLLENNLVGKKSALGTGTYWKGIETASRISPTLH